MTTTHPRHRDGKPFVCSECGGPCRSYKGSIHKWKCSSCINAYLAAQPDQTAGRR